VILDDPGLPKQGRSSVEVACPYSDTLGKVANCQVVGSAHYIVDEPTSCAPVHWPRSVQRSLPRPVPPEVTLQTEPALALTLVEQERAWGVPGGTDAGHGANPTGLLGLGDRHVAYVVGVRSTFGVRLSDEGHAAMLSHQRFSTGPEG
jgi:SRSO17 transposase